MVGGYGNASKVEGELAYILSDFFWAQKLETN